MILAIVKWTAIIVGTTVALYATADMITMACTGKHITDHIKNGLLQWLKGDNTDVSNEQKSLENVPSISGAKNTSNYNTVYPFIMGKHLFTPKFVGKPYTMITGTDGEEQYYIAEYLMGYDELLMTNFKLGTRDLASNNLGTDRGFVLIDGYFNKNDPSIEICPPEVESTLYPQKVSEEQLSIQLMNVANEPNGKLEVVRFSSRYPQKVQVEVTMQGLIGYSTSSKEEDRTVSVSCVYSTDGGKTWQPFGAFIGCSSYDANTGTSTWTKRKNKVMRFVAERTLDYEEAINCTNKVIEIKIMRENNEATDQRTSDTTYLSAIRTWCYDYSASLSEGELVPQKPMIAKDVARTTRVAFRIKANDALTGQLEAFNCIVQCKGRTYSNGSWTPIGTNALTQNPASIALLALQSSMRGFNAYDDSKIDLTSFGEFYDWCEEHHFKCNGVLCNEKKTVDLVNQILQCGKGVLTIVGNKYGVLIDKPRENPVMILNAQNILEANNSKDFAKLPDGYKVSFINEVNDYTEDEMIVCYDGHSASDADLELENVDLPFVTDPSQVWKIIRYQLACRKLRPEIWNRKVGVEGSLIEIGNLVTIQDETLVVGIGEGAEVIEPVIKNGYVTGIKTDGTFDVTDTSQEYCVKIMVANGVDTPKVVKHKVVIPAVGMYSDFTFDEPVLSGAFDPQAGDIVTFGVYNLESIDAICFGKKSNNDGTYDLTLIPYSEGVYTADSGTIPEFDSKVSNPKDYSNTLITEKDASTDFVKSVMSGITEGTATDISAPNDPSNLLAVAEQNKITLSCELVGSGLSNTILGYYWEVRKSTTGSWIPLDSEEYIFDRALDGYPEAEDFQNWRFRVRAKNVYYKYSDYVGCTVSTSKYGTWLVTPPTISTRTSDRTITLIFGNEGRSVYKQQYGEVRYKIQVARYDDYVYDEHGNIVLDENNNPVLQYYEPNVNANPRPVRDAQGQVIQGNELNYKTESTTAWATSGSSYSQTMPLKHQDGINWIDENQTVQNGAIDTQYYFKVVAYNATVNSALVNTDSEPRYAGALACCTNIRDIVYANASIKEQYVQKLSAICANLGEISQGSLAGSDDNYWVLSTKENAQNPKDFQGAFRVGGRNKYLKVIPQVVNGVIVDYEFVLNVGAFEITSESTNLNSELIIYNPDISKYDRTRITVSGTYYEHRTNEMIDTRNVEGGWFTVAKQESSGLLCKQVYSEESVLFTNTDILERRKQYLDIGKVYLSANSRVFHFDHNAKDQNGNTDYTLITSPSHADEYPVIVDRDGVMYSLEGAYVGVNNDPIKRFEPAILAIAPYSEVARSIYGIFGLQFNMNLTNNSFTVDFWIKYYYAEGQVLFDIGTEQDRIQIVCVSGEPNYNVPQEYVVANPQPTTQVQVYAGEYYVRKEGEYVRVSTYNSQFTYYVHEPEPPYNYDVNKEGGFVVANPQPQSQSDLNGANLYYTESEGNFSRATTFVEGETYYYYIFAYNHAKVNANDVYIRHQGASTFEIVRTVELPYVVATPQPNNASEFAKAKYFKYVNGEYVIAETYEEGVQYYTKGEVFPEGVWKHIAVVMTPTEISCYIGNSHVTFARYSQSSNGATAIINDSEHSMILDELLIDETTAETVESFKASSLNKIPWGAIDSSDNYMMILAKEDSQGKPLVHTNIFKSDEFKNAVQAIIDAQKE